MKASASLTALSLALSAASVFAAPPRPSHAASPDLLSPPARLAPQAMLQGRQASPSSQDVGDADSFGRDVHYVGIIASPDVSLQDTPCDPSTDPASGCVTLNPQPQVTTFSFNDMGHITLPARSTHSLLCFQTSAFNQWMFQNTTAVPQQAEIQFRESVTIESTLLADPSLIDPTTGQPFNGKLTSSIGLSTWQWRTLQPGAQQGDAGWVTRGCQGGAISKTALKETYGLPDHIVKQFFQMPMTIRLNVSGEAQLVEFGGVTVGVRFYGD